MRRDPVEDERRRATWRATVCELSHDGVWLALATAVPAAPTVVVTAWNPLGLLLPEAVNRARDAVLVAELVGRGVERRRARGRDPAGTWIEEGWALSYAREDALRLLRRYGQLAAFVFVRGRRSLLWADGDEEDFPEAAAG